MTGLRNTDVAAHTTPADSLCAAFDRIETSLQRVLPGMNWLEWVADEGEPAMESLRVLRSMHPEPGTDLALYEPLPFPGELEACQDALGNIEIHIYEAWKFDTITKDAARHFLVIADICGWTMEWVEEMREWAS